MAEIITTLAQATPEWLTTVLPYGQVVAVHQRVNAAFNSSVAHLELSYASGFPAQASSKFLLKLNQEEWGENEVALYKLAANQNPAMVFCHAAEYDPTTGNSYLLLEDISATHHAPLTREQVLRGEGVPSDYQLEQIIITMARFQAYFWQHPQLGQPPNLTQVRWYRDKTFFLQHLQRRRDEFAIFTEKAAQEVPSELLGLYSDTLAKLPGLWERYFAPRVSTLKNMTISQGDCYFTQFLCPKDPTNDHSTYLVDFQDSGANFPAFDLVYLLATFWTPEQRHYQNREEKLLRLYLSVLERSGVSGYSWDDLLTDYKLMLIIVMLVPVWDQSYGASKSYWWPEMKCLTDNFQDLNCAALFDF